MVLLGSAARATSTWRSDTDFLVITPTHLPRWRATVDLSIILETRDTFLRKLGEGNDFAAWAVRFGVVCIDPSGWWSGVLSDERAKLWPDWRLKVEHARKRQSVAVRLLGDGDWDAAEEEYLLAASHITRALLLRVHVFPLSRPEMPGQLVQIGLPNDARSLELLIEGTRNPGELRQIAASVEHRLNELERLELEGSEKRVRELRIEKEQMEREVSNLKSYLHKKAEELVWCFANTVSSSQAARHKMTALGSLPKVIQRANEVLETPH